MKLPADIARCMGRGHLTDCPLRRRCKRWLVLQQPGLGAPGCEVSTHRDLRDPRDGGTCEHLIEASDTAEAPAP